MRFIVVAAAAVVQLQQDNRLLESGTLVTQLVSLRLMQRRIERDWKKQKEKKRRIKGKKQQR